MKTKAAITASMLGAVLVAATVLTAAPTAQALEAGDIIVRARLVNVMPNDDSGPVVVGGGAVAGSGVKVDNGPTLDIDFGYMFTDNIGAELLLDLTSKHDISATGSLAANGKLGDVRVLPPTLLLQYHFLPKNNVRPYVGAGLNYTTFLKEDLTASAINGPLAMAGLKLDSSWGPAFQAGVDIDLDGRWFLNFDVKYIDIDTTAKFTVGGTPSSVDVDIDPWVVGVGIGMTF